VPGIVRLVAGSVVCIIFYFYLFLVGYLICWTGGPFDEFNS
jgi:hypothetical protein